MSTDTAVKVDTFGSPAGAGAGAGADIKARWHRPLLGFTALAALLALVAALGMVVDDRAVTGSPVWFKPFKFAASFGLYSAALAWMLHLSQRARRLGWWVGTVIAAASTAEVGAIVLQTVRGRASHFNVATPFDQAVVSFMGAAVMVIWLATFVIAVIVSARPLVDRATTLAIRFGLGLSLVGMLLAVLMTRPTPEQQLADDSGAWLTTAGAHSVGVPDGGPSQRRGRARRRRTNGDRCRTGNPARPRLTTRYQQPRWPSSGHLGCSFPSMRGRGAPSTAVQMP